MVHGGALGGGPGCFDRTWRMGITKYEELVLDWFGYALGEQPGTVLVLLIYLWSAPGHADGLW